MATAAVVAAMAGAAAGWQPRDPLMGREFKLGSGVLTTSCRLMEVPY
ncbi:hypothetical protein N7E70_007265 [Aminobacter sp. NyZ550]|nr:hypothetical protein [Aminobacter sp. NyZ550]WAX96652.1 hypothetical protein N7E70_007265 [Aminobacter sp. NyZ550]